MKTEILLITPAVARNWLKHNTENRVLRPGMVEGFRVAYERGEWKTTHQGIAFSKTGRLLDGQHRLTFISQLPEGTQVPMNVSRDMDEDVFGAIDQGSRRTVSDVLGVSSGLSAAGRFFAKLVNTDKHCVITPQSVAPFIAWVQPEYEVLTTFCSKKVKIWSSAPVQSAAILRMKQGYDVDFINLAYHSLCMAEVESMPYAARALMSQHMSGKIVSARSLDLFVRALRVFDSTKNFKINHINVKDQAGSLKDVRDFIIKQAKKDPALARSTVAKPGANSKPRLAA